MHFSQSYSQLLLTVPAELRTSAIEYRQLKSIINDLVIELGSLGLNPHVLHQLLQRTEHSLRDTSPGTPPVQTLGGPDSPILPATIVYELTDRLVSSGDIVPRLKIRVGNTALDDLRRLCHPTAGVATTPILSKESDLDATLSTLPPSAPILNRALQEHSTPPKTHSSCIKQHTSPTTGSTCQLVVPLASDRAFFRLLTTALTSLTTSLDSFRESFIVSIQTLSTVIACTSRPASVKGKSDLYLWRAIFQLYLETQVFESTSEIDHGERPVAESEARLTLFTRRVGEAGFSLKIPESRVALEHFMELNTRLLHFKKFQHANAKAAHRILRKHTTHTALPLPKTAAALIPSLSLGNETTKVSHVLVVVLTETLMSVVPPIDDYLCIVCFALAFKPIRLNCGHLFCVRCLVKMQKQGQNSCPLCRAPTVTIANKSNVDHALSNFMYDWFPKETKEKAKANNRESAQEEMEELGLDTRCVVM